MSKLSKSTLFVGLISFVIVVGLVIGLVCTNQQKSHWENKVGEYNLNQWSTLCSVLMKLDREGYTVETVKEVSPYVNSLIGGTYSPPLYVTEKSIGFLGGYYHPFLQTIATEKLSASERRSALLLLETANKEFISLMTDLIDAEKKIQLVDESLDEYKQIQQALNVFCNQYSSQIAPFIED